MRKNLSLYLKYTLFGIGTGSFGCHGKKKVNIMVVSWHTMMEFEPPLVGCAVSNRGSSFCLLKTTGECVINIPKLSIAQKAVGCGNVSGDKINKLKNIGLTPQPAAKVGAPLIEECYANLECRLIDKRMVSDYCFFILEVVKTWIDPKVKSPRTIHHLGKGHFMIPGKKIEMNRI